MKLDVVQLTQGNAAEVAGRMDNWSEEELNRVVDESARQNDDVYLNFTDHGVLWLWVDKLKPKEYVDEQLQSEKAWLGRGRI